MKAAPVAYARPTTLAEAVSLLAEHGEEARLLAGGQSLVTLLNMRLSAPSLLIDINHLPELTGITEQGDRVRIGAMTRHRELGASGVVAQRLPLIAAAIPHIAHPAIRNRGTIGGSLALADPASELPACCLALQAVIIARGPNGERRITADDFFQGLYATALQADEVLVAVEFPVPAAGAVWGFDELARRHGDYALVGLAATGRQVAGRLADTRFVFFGIGDRPALAKHAAAALEAGDVRAAQAALDGDLDPQDDPVVKSATRKHLARVLLGRVVSTMMGRTV